MHHTKNKKDLRFLLFRTKKFDPKFLPIFAFSFLHSAFTENSEYFAVSDHWDHFLFG